MIEPQRPIGLLDNSRPRQKRLQQGLARNRPAAWSTTAMRGRKRLVQVQVHHVRPKVPRPRLAHQRVHVRAVHVQQRALRMQNFRDLMHLRLKHPNRRRIGQHQRGRILVHRRPQLVQVDRTLRIRLQVLHLVPNHSSRRRICPMRRVRHKHRLARIALTLVVRPAPSGCR